MCLYFLNKTIACLFWGPTNLVIVNIFFILPCTDLYDGFIEANKKEDPVERMWAIRSMVSFVYSMMMR